MNSLLHRFHDELIKYILIVIYEFKIESLRKYFGVFNPSESRHSMGLVLST